MDRTNLDHQLELLLSSVSDEKLLQLCQRYGEQARTWRQKFAGLLPEVNKRRLYAKKGFHSIFEFASKLAGMSEEQVRLVLNLEKKFEDKPVLQSLLVNGEVSANKLVRVASIATPENQEALAEHAKILPQKALETLVRDEKLNLKETEAKNNFQLWDKDDETKVGVSGNSTGKIDRHLQSFYGSLRAHSKPSQLFEDVKLLQKFSDELKEKLQQLDQKGIDINKVLLELLRQREAAIEHEKEQIVATMIEENEWQGVQITEQMDGKTASESVKKRAANQSTENGKRISQYKKSSKPSRYIPIKIKRIITNEHGAKCSIPSCSKPSEHIHHTQRFGLMQHVAPQLAHDPRYLTTVQRAPHHRAFNRYPVSGRQKCASIIDGGS